MTLPLTSRCTNTTHYSWSNWKPLNHCQHHNTSYIFVLPCCSLLCFMVQMYTETENLCLCSVVHLLQTSGVGQVCAVGTGWQRGGRSCGLWDAVQSWLHLWWHHTSASHQLSSADSAAHGKHGTASQITAISNNNHHCKVVFPFHSLDFLFSTYASYVTHCTNKCTNVSLCIWETELKKMALM